MPITFNPITQPLPPRPALTAWLVHGIHPATGAKYSGTSWGRTEEEARTRHDRLHEADLRIKREMGAPDPGIDLSGYVFTYTMVPPTY